MDSKELSHKVDRDAFRQEFMEKMTSYEQKIDNRTPVQLEHQRVKQQIVRLQALICDQQKRLARTEKLKNIVDDAMSKKSSLENEVAFERQRNKDAHDKMGQINDLFRKTMKEKNQVITTFEQEHEWRIESARQDVRNDRASELQRADEEMQSYRIKIDEMKMALASIELEFSEESNKVREDYVKQMNIQRNEAAAKKNQLRATIARIKKECLENLDAIEFQGHGQITSIQREIVKVVDERERLEAEMNRLECGQGDNTGPGSVRSIIKNTAVVKPQHAPPRQIIRQKLVPTATSRRSSPPPPTVVDLSPVKKRITASKPTRKKLRPNTDDPYMSFLNGDESDF